jgi:ferritin-like metal-binding protein YciE
MYRYALRVENPYRLPDKTASQLLLTGPLPANEEIMTLHELFIDELRDLNSAENQLIKALPKMVKAATSSELKKAFQDHLTETKNQVERLKKAFESVSEKPRSTLCKGMAGLVEEGKEHIEDDAGDVLGDLALIGAGERVEHYEIAAYTTAISMAKVLKYSDAADLLTETLGEEQKAAKLLFELAKPMLREAAKAQG